MTMTRDSYTFKLKTHIFNKAILTCINEEGKKWKFLRNKRPSSFKASHVIHNIIQQENFPKNASNETN